jgi:hypothetical protein
MGAFRSGEEVKDDDFESSMLDNKYTSWNFGGEPSTFLQAKPNHVHDA